MKSWNDILANAYGKYSGLLRVAVVRGETGELFCGVRVENASFPLTIGACQSAIFNCISEGVKPEALFLPEDYPEEMSGFWSDRYNLAKTVDTSFPEGNFRNILRPAPSDFRSELNELQKFCQIQESDFPVSCLLQVGEDSFIAGVNIEIPEWQMGLCAERIAIAKAVSSGYTTFRAIHIQAKYGDFISPCGACRQVLVEHMPYKDMHLYHADKTYSRHTPADFLPAFFNGSSIPDSNGR